MRISDWSSDVCSSDLEAVIPPVGEALPNTEIFRRLAARFGFDDPCFRASDAELMDDAIDGADPRLGGVAPSALPLGAARNMTAPDGRSPVVQIGRAQG